jgi:hypothetical protein
MAGILSGCKRKIPETACLDECTVNLEARQFGGKGTILEVTP